jgi:hypothetical protein
VADLGFCADARTANSIQTVAMLATQIARVSHPTFVLFQNLFTIAS